MHRICYPDKSRPLFPTADSQGQGHRPIVGSIFNPANSLSKTLAFRIIPEAGIRLFRYWSSCVSIIIDVTFPCGSTSGIGALLPHVLDSAIILPSRPLLPAIYAVPGDNAAPGEDVACFDGWPPGRFFAKILASRQDAGYDVATSPCRIDENLLEIVFYGNVFRR